MKILLAGATVIRSYEREIQVKKRMPTLAVVLKDMFIKQPSTASSVCNFYSLV
jgi:hypothetical protein